jgi:Tfp pilus assembly protein PilF
MATRGGIYVLCLLALVFCSEILSQFSFVSLAASVLVTQLQESTQTQRPEVSEETMRRANEFLKSGSLHDAEKQVRMNLAKEPDSWVAHFLLGLILFKQGRAKESLAEYTEGAKHHTPSAEDLKIVALNYVLLGDFNEADKWLSKSIAWNPDDAEAWYHLGRTKYNENHLQEAVEAFRRCLQLQERNVKAKSNLGLSLAGLGRVAEAQSTYREAIAWQAQSAVKTAEPYIDLGDLLLDQNQTDEAVVLLLTADAISPEDVRVPEMLGKAYWRQNKLEEAQRQLERAVKLAPASAANHYLLAQVYRKQGMTEKAKIEFDHASELSAPKALPASVNH